MNMILSQDCLILIESLIQEKDSLHIEMEPWFSLSLLSCCCDLAAILCDISLSGWPIVVPDKVSATQGGILEILSIPLAMFSHWAMDFILTNHIRDYKSAEKMVNVQSVAFSTKSCKFDVNDYVFSDYIDTHTWQALI